MMQRTSADIVSSLARKDPSARWSIEQVLESPLFSGLPRFPYKSGLNRNPSYPKPGVTRLTMNPLTPLRAPEDPSPQEAGGSVTRLRFPAGSPQGPQSASGVEDTAREMMRDSGTRASQTLMPAMGSLSSQISGLTTPEQVRHHHSKTLNLQFGLHYSYFVSSGKACFWFSPLYQQH